MKSPGKLYFTIGLPRSGKSTYCDLWVRESPVIITNTWGGPRGKVSRPRVMVAGDDFRFALHANNYIPDSEPMVFAMMDIAIRAHIHRGIDVIVDETATTEGTIKRYLRIDPEATPVWVNTPVDVCKQRAIETNRSYLIPPIERLAAQFEKLKAEWPHNFLRWQAEVEQRRGLDVAA